MAVFDLACRECGNAFQIVTRGAIRQKQKRCPQCDSEDVRQTLGSYLRNGSLSHPACGAPAGSGFG